MRTLAGIALIALALSVSAFGGEGNNSLSSERDKHFNLKPDGPSARTFTAGSGTFTADDLPGFEAGDNVCYTMHTLVVAREKGTDSTRIVRQQTCTPSDRFRVNHSAKPPRLVK